MTATAAQLEQSALVIEAEQLLMFAEANAGVSIKGATRPLFDHEVRACVRFGDIDQTLTEAERLAVGSVRDALTRILETVKPVLAECDTPEELQAAVARMVMSPPAPVTKAVDALASDLGGVLADVRARGQESVIAEAKRQGVDVPAEFADVPAGTADAAAMGVAGALWQKVTDRLGVAARDPKTNGSAADVLADAAKHEYKSVVDSARQASHVLHGAGRADGIAAVPREPSAIWASELLDRNTCEKCWAVDGKEFDTLAEAYLVYPNAGPMGDCEGGNRCRGTLVIEWPLDGGAPSPTPKSETPDSGGPADDRYGVGDIADRLAKRPLPVPKADDDWYSAKRSQVTTMPEKSSVGWDSIQPLPGSGVLPRRGDVSMIWLGKEPDGLQYDAAKLHPDDGVPKLQPKGITPNPSDAINARGWVNREGNRAPGRENNCTNVVIAQEFGARGYSVSALPRPRGRSRTDYMKDFIDPRTMQNAWNNSIVARSANDLVVKLKLASVGDRGFLALTWADGDFGHVVMWQRTEDGVFIAEGQEVGELVRIEDYARRLLYDPVQNPEFIRTNDLIFVGDPTEYMETDR